MADNKKKLSKYKKAKNYARNGARAVSSMVGLLDAIGGIRDTYKNHPEWYEKYPLDGLVQLNFGQREHLSGNTSITVGTHTKQGAPDCVFDTDLVIPKARGGSGFWEGIQIIMNKLRAASGSNITYDNLDLALYVLDTREILAEYCQIKRTILALRAVDPYDADAPLKYALMSMGMRGAYSRTLTDITADLASDTARVNRLTHIIKNMIPLNIDLHKRTAWLFSNFFADFPGQKFSTKVFATGEIGVWKKTATGVERKVADVITHKNTLHDRVTDLEGMIGSFMNKTENSRIAGDILKAFGASAFIPMTGIDEKMSIQPIYDEFALSQLQNASIFRTYTASQGDGPDITSTPNATTIQYIGDLPVATGIHTLASAANTRKLVNTPKGAVTPAEVISLTRLVTLGEFDTTGTNVVFNVECCGTEIVSTIAWATGWSATGGGQITAHITMPEDPSNVAAMLSAAECWSMDDWAPEVMISNTGGVAKSLFDLSNWAVADINDIADYHALAILSMMATPMAIKERSEFKFVI